MSDDLSGFSLMELFRTEAEAQTQILCAGLLELETKPATASVIEPLMRAAHSLKGAARIVGLSAAEEIAHALEDVFVDAQKGRFQLQPRHVDSLLASVDLLSEASRVTDSQIETWKEANAEKIAATLSRLKAVQAGEAPAAPVTAAPDGEPGESGEAGEEEEGAALAVHPEADAPLEPAPQAEGLIEIAAGASEAAEAKGKASTKRKQRTRIAKAGPSEPEVPAQAAPAAVVAPAVAPGETARATRPTAAATTAPAASAQAEGTPAMAPAAPTSSSAGAQVESQERVVRVTAENLNRLMGLAGESLVEARHLRPIVDSLVELKNQQDVLWGEIQNLEDHYATLPDSQTRRERELLNRIKHEATRSLEEISGRITRLESHARRSEDLSERLHHEVISSRLRPFIDCARGFPRLVRDLARQTDKQVQLEILGEQTGVDRDILDKLEAPLNHLVRNALDHGIETPQERQQAGKDPVASLRLEARHVAGMLQITITDDGRGIDSERVRQRVVDRGLVSDAMAQQLSEAETLEFLFLPGFSTKTEVTAISGRGVGLDVVQSMAQAVGGSVRVSTQLGRGTCFSLQLPITMSVIRALLVRIGGEPYAFPLSRLDRIQLVPTENVEVIEGRQFFRMDEQTVGLVPATQVLELPQKSDQSLVLPAVILSDRGHCFGVIVDEFLGERDLDVRPLDPRLGKVPNINSATVLEDGWPVLIIDVEDMVRNIDNILHSRRFKLMGRGDAGAAAAAAKRVLVVDDSITVRELERQLLQSRGYHVETAVDGVDGWNAIRSATYDLLVSDVDMPRMDGIQLVRQVKQDNRLKLIPVIIVSYKDREEDRLRGLDAGADCYLTKSSFHDETFLNTVHDLIGENRG